MRLAAQLGKHAAELDRAGNAGGKEMVPPPAAFVAVIASRNVQSATVHAPSLWSSVVVTTRLHAALDRADVHPRTFPARKPRAALIVR